MSRTDLLTPGKTVYYFSNSFILLYKCFRPIMRSRKYLSLRVKLLKRQFGLPNDLMSLKSMSITSTNPRRDVNENSGIASSVPASSNSAFERSAYNGVHRVCPGKDRGPITSVRFAHNRFVLRAL